MLFKILNCVSCNKITLIEARVDANKAATEPGILSGQIEVNKFEYFMTCNS
jgi:hypothetical protein